MVGHQLVISLAYYNNNIALQLDFNESTTCYLEEVMMVPKMCYSESRGCTCTPLHLPVGAHVNKARYPTRVFHVAAARYTLRRLHHCPFSSTNWRPLCSPEVILTVLHTLNICTFYYDSRRYFSYIVRCPSCHY